jgi:hypothetical protein
MRTLRDSRSTSRTANETLALGLAWFSIGLGLGELLMPRAVGRAIGMRDKPRLLRSYGLREIATGVGLMAADNKAPWLWGRVAGDALDLATLGAHLPRSKVGPSMGIGAVLGVMLLDIACAQAMSDRQRRRARPHFDYSDRSGFSRPVNEMRGIAADKKHGRQPEKQESQPVEATLAL